MNMNRDNCKRGIPLTLRVSEAVYNAIREFIGDHRAERGGMLGCDRDGVVRHFEADPGGRCSAGAYDPDITRLNEVIKQWKKQGITFCGFVHSHPFGYRRLSPYDVWYAGEILSCFKKLDVLWLPIIQTVPDTGSFQVYTFGAVPGSGDRKHCTIVPAEIEVVDQAPEMAAAQAATRQVVVAGFPTTDGIDRKSPVRAGGRHSTGGLRSAEDAPAEAMGRSETWLYHGNFPCIWAQSELNPSRRSSKKGPIPSQTARSALVDQQVAESVRDNYLVRLEEAYDVGLLDGTRLVFIGLGGAASLARNAARMGFGEFFLIDFDDISSTNVASQQANPENIGRPKVTSLAEDIMAINPAAAVVSIRERIEGISDAQFKVIFGGPLRAKPRNQGRQVNSTDDAGASRLLQPQCAKRVVLLVLTDDFEAQARGHRLGLHFGIPTICAQEYREGRGAEVTYTVAGITPACHRCVTASRYRDYLQNGFKNDVTSAGAPVFAAEFLNAVLGHVLLAVAHHGTEHPRWGKMVRRLGARNLVRIRMDPEFDEMFGNTFARRQEGAAGIDGMFMLDTLFLTQTPDHGQTRARPVCPDCGGTGDLTRVIGTFDDTREMRATDSSYIFVQDDKGLLQLPCGSSKGL